MLMPSCICHAPYYKVVPVSGGSKICLLGGLISLLLPPAPPFLLPPSFLSSSSPSFLPLFSMVFWGVGGAGAPSAPPIDPPLIIHGVMVPGDKEWLWLGFRNIRRPGHLESLDCHENLME